MESIAVCHICKPFRLDPRAPLTRALLHSLISKRRPLQSAREPCMASIETVDCGRRSFLAVEPRRRALGRNAKRSGARIKEHSCPCQSLAVFLRTTDSAAAGVRRCDRIHGSAQLCGSCCRSIHRSGRNFGCNDVLSRERWC